MANTVASTQHKEILICHMTRAKRAACLQLSHIFNNKKRLQGTLNNINKDGKPLN